MHIPVFQTCNTSQKKYKGSLARHSIPDSPKSNDSFLFWLCSFVVLVMSASVQDIYKIIYFNVDMVRLSLYERTDHNTTTITVLQLPTKRFTTPHFWPTEEPHTLVSFFQQYEPNSSSQICCRSLAEVCSTYRLFLLSSSSQSMLDGVRCAGQEVVLASLGRILWVIITSERLGAYQMVLHGSEESCGSRFGSGFVSLRNLDPEKHLGTSHFVLLIRVWHLMSHSVDLPFF